MALVEPVTLKTTERGENERLDYAVSAMQDHRVNMEDAHAIVLNLDAATGTLLLGVYDGHGGPAVSKYCARHLHIDLHRHESSRDNLQTAIERIFLRMDEMMKDWRAGRELSRYGGNEDWEAYRKAMCMSRFIPFCQNPAYQGPENDGCTACVVLIRGNQIIVGNAGDSRCVLSKNDQEIELSTNFKPNHPAGRQRIEAAGHVITFIERGNVHRIDDRIAISRSLGDLLCKDNNDLDPLEQAITAFPEVHTEGITQDDKFLIIVRDGIWINSSPMALDEPMTLKTTERGENERLDCAVSVVQGHRVNMEDAHAIVLNLDAVTGTSFFGVYDGHGGSYAEILLMKQEKEEMDRGCKEQLYPNDAIGHKKEKDSLIKQLEGSVDENKPHLICLDSRLQSMEQELKLKDDVCISLKGNLESSESKKLVKPDHQVNTLENQISQLHSVLDENEQLYLCSVERDRTLEDQRLQVEASGSATECQPSEAKKQYCLMLEGEKIELSNHLKEISLKNDQAFSEISKKFELEKREITNAEEEKAEKLIREIENKCNEKISQNKHGAEKYLIFLKEEHGTMEEKRRALLQSQWKAMGKIQEIHQMNSKKIITRPIHTSSHRNRKRRKDLTEECYPGNTATIVLDRNDLVGSTRSYIRGIKKAREWCRSNRRPFDLSKHFGPGAEVYTTPGKGTFYLTYKYDGRSLTFPLSGRDLYLKGFHGGRFGSFKIDKEFIKDQNYKFLDTGDNYTDLCQDRTVSTVRIGIDPVIEKFEVLYKCNGVVSKDVLRALAVFAVHGPEAIRLQDVFKAVLDAYNYKRSLVGKELALLVNNYGFYSTQLLYCLDHMIDGKEVPEIVNKDGINIKSVQELMNKIRVPLWSSYLSGNFKPGDDEETYGWCLPYADNNWESADETDDELDMYQTNDEINETDDDISLSKEEEQTEETEDSKLKTTPFSEIRSSIDRFVSAIAWGRTDRIGRNGPFDFSQYWSRPVFGRAVHSDCMDQNGKSGLLSSKQYQNWHPKRHFSSTLTLVRIRKLLRSCSTRW